MHVKKTMPRPKEMGIEMEDHFIYSYYSNMIVLLQVKLRWRDGRIKSN